MQVDELVLAQASYGLQRNSDLVPHEQELRDRNDEAGYDGPLLRIGEGVCLFAEIGQAQIPAQFFDACYPGSENVLDGNRFCERHSNLHVFPQRYEDPNEDKCVQIQALVASGCFAVAVDSASAIHRHQNIMVNGVSS